MKNTDKTIANRKGSVDTKRDKKTLTPGSDKNKKQKGDPNFRPSGSDSVIGDGSAGLGGTSAI